MGTHNEKFVITGDISDALNKNAILRADLKKMQSEMSVQEKFFANHLRASSGRVQDQYFSRNASDSAKAFSAAIKEEESAWARRSVNFAKGIAEAAKASAAQQAIEQANQARLTEIAAKGELQRSAIRSGVVASAPGSKSLFASNVFTGTKAGGAKGTVFAEMLAKEQEVWNVKASSFAKGIAAAAEAAMAQQAIEKQNQKRLSEIVAEGEIARGAARAASAEKTLAVLTAQGKAAQTIARTNNVKVDEENWQRKAFISALAGDPRGIKHAATTGIGVPAMAALGGGALVGGLAAHEVKKSMEWGHDIELGAGRMGASTKNFQELAYVGNLAGMEMDEFAASFTKMADAIEKHPDLFKKTGLTAANLKYMDPAKAMMATISAISKIENPFERRSMYRDMFGKKGGALGGIGNIDELVAGASKNGAIVGEKDIKTLADAQEAWEKLTLSIKGFIAIKAAEAINIPGPKGWLAGLGLLGKSPDADVMTENNARMAALGRKVEAGGAAKAIAKEESDKRASIDAEERKNQVAAARESAKTTLSALMPPREKLEEAKRQIELLYSATDKEGKHTELDAGQRENLLAEAQRRYNNEVRMSLSPLDELTSNMETLNRQWANLNDTERDSLEMKQQHARAEREIMDATKDRIGASTPTDKYMRKLEDIREVAPSLAAYQNMQVQSVYAEYAGTQQDSGWLGRGPNPDELGTYAFRKMAGHNPVTGSYGRDSVIHETAIRGKYDKDWSGYRPATPAGYGPSDGAAMEVLKSNPDQDYAEAKARSEFKAMLGVESPADDLKATMYELDSAFKKSAITQEEYDFGVKKANATQFQQSKRIFEATPEGMAYKKEFEATSRFNDRIQGIRDGQLVDSIFPKASMNGGLFGSTDDPTGALAMSRSKNTANYQQQLVEIDKQILRAILELNNDRNAPDRYPQGVSP